MEKNVTIAMLQLLTTVHYICLLLKMFANLIIYRIEAGYIHLFFLLFETFVFANQMANTI